MRPTPRARQLAAPIGAAIARLREAIEPGPAFRPEATRAEFRIAATDYVEALLMGPLTEALRREAPLAGVRSMRPPRVFVPPEQALRAGEVDLALGLFGSPASPTPGLLTMQLLRDRLVAVVRAGHPGVGRRLTLERFLRLPQIRILYPGDEQAGLIDWILGSRRLTRRVALTVSHQVPVPGIVASSDLLGITPERLALRWTRVHGLRILDLPIPVPALHLTMVWDERRGSQAGGEWLRGIVARTVGVIG
jgi:DNA-binding transcriptional LysR family regulator